MEIECDLASIRDEDLLRKMWQQSEDFGRKKEIRSHLYKLRESRLREFYSTAGPGGDIIMNPSTDLCFGKTPLTPSHGDSLVDQSFQSLKSKEVRDSESPSREIKFRNSGGVAGGVLVPDTTGWNVQTSSEVSPDGRAFRTETLAKTDGVEKIPGGRAEFAGRNEQKSSASHQGDDKNFVKKAAESSKTHLQEKIVVGDENSGRTEMKSSSVTSSSSKVVSSSSQVISSGDPGFDLEPRYLTQEPRHLTQEPRYLTPDQQQYEKILTAANTNTVRQEQQQQQYQRNERSERNERNETSSNVREESRKYVDMDKASPEYQQHVQYLMSQPGAIVSNTVEYPKPGVKMITTVKQLPDGTTVKTKRYETEASADTGSVTQTVKQNQQQRVSSSSTQKSTTEKRVQDSEDVFTRLARTRDNNVPVSPRKTPETPSQEDIYSRLQKSRGDQQKFSDTIDQRSTQILRDTNELISSNKTVKKDLSQAVRNEKITSDDFIQTERDRYVLDRDAPSRRGPEGLPEALVPITPGRFTRPQPDDTPTNGYTSTGVIQQSSKSSTKFSESRRFSTETVESYHENDTTQGYPSTRRPIDEPKGRSPSGGRPDQGFSTHGFPSVRSDKPTQEYPSSKPSTHEEYVTTERVHIVSTDRPEVNTSTTRRHVTSTTDDFSTHGFPSVRAGTPTRDSPRTGDSPRRPSGQEPAHQGRRTPTDSFSTTHGFPSVKTGSPTEDYPRRPSAPDQGRRPTEDYSPQGFPSVKPGRATPTQSAPDDSQRTPNRRQPSVDRDDTHSVTSDRSNSITYEKRIDAAHQAFARSLRCASPVESIRRDSISDRSTPRTSVSTTIRNSYSPSKRDGRSPSHESITNSESSRISSGTVTKTTHHVRPINTDIRRVSGPKSPIGKNSPNHVSNETIDLTLTRKITARPTDNKPAAGRPSTTVNDTFRQPAEPVLRKKIFAQTEDFLASEGVAEEPIIKKESYYQLGPSDATLPSSRLPKTRQVLGTTPNTSRRVTTYNTDGEVNNTYNTTRSTKTPQQDNTKPNNKQPDTLYSSKPKTKPEGYVTLNRATEITDKHNQTTNKQVSYPHYIPSAPKAHPERPTSTSDRPTKNLSSPAPTTTSTNTTSTTTPHNAPTSFTTDKPKVVPSTTKPSSSSPTKVDNSTTRFTKTVKVDNAITRDTTKTRREPERGPKREPLQEPEDIDEGYVPDRTGQRRPTSKRPTSDDEGFEPESPRAGSPTSDFEYRRPTQTETYDEEDSLFKRTRKTDKKVVTNEFLDTERGVKPRGPTGPGDKVPKGAKPSFDGPSGGKQPRRPEEQEPTYGETRPRPSGPIDSQSPERRKPSYLTDDEPNAPSGPRRPGDKEPRGPTDRGVKGPTRPEDRPSYLTDDEPNAPSGPRRPGDKEPRGPTDRGVKGPTAPRDSQSPERRKPSYLTDEPRRPEDRPSYLTDEEPNAPSGPRRPEDEPSGPSKPRGTKPPLDRSETFEERCRQILGMEDETTIDKTKRIQDFIDTERVTVDIRRKPGDRSPSPQKKQPSDTVSIEDCDDDDDGVPRKYPSQRDTTTSRTTTKTTKGDYPRDRSPTEKTPKGTRPSKVDETTTTTTTRSTRPRDGSPTDKSPLDKTLKGTRPSKVGDETTVTTTTTSSTRPRDGSPLGKTPQDTSPTRTGETTVRRTTTRDTTIVDEIDDRSPTRRPRDGSPLGKTPKITRQPEFEEPTGTRPRDGSPYGRRPTEETTVTNVTSRRDTTTQETIDDVFEPTHPRDRPRGLGPIDDTTFARTTTTRDTTISGLRDYPRDRSPTEKPRGRSPTNDTTTFTRTTTRDTTITGETDDRSPRDRSPTKDYPRERSPADKPRGGSPLDGTTVKRTTTTTRDTTIIDEIDDRSPLSRPRDRSPSEKPTRGPRPTDVDEPRASPRGRSPTEKLIRSPEVITTATTTEYGIKERPRSQSPSEKPRKSRPVDTEEIDETYVQKTTRTTKDTTTVNEFDKPSRRPRPSEETDTEDHPRRRSPEKPKGTRPSDTYETTVQRTVTDKTVIDDRTSPLEKPKRPSDRSPSPRSKVGDKYPRGARPTDEETSPRDRSPTGKQPRGSSPSEKPRGRYPTDEETEETLVQRTTKVATDRTTVDDRSPKDRPRGTSPTEKPRRRPSTDEEIDETIVQRTSKTTRDRTTLEETTDRPRGTSPTQKPSPRGTSPSEKPRGPRPTEETIVQRTTKVTTDRTTVDDRSPKDRPRGTSPTEKPRRRPSTDEEIDETIVQRTSKTTRDRKTLEETTDRPRGTSPTQKPSPRGTSPSEKPRGPRPTEETIVQRTTKVTTDRTTVDDRSPKDRPRGTSPTEKPRRRPSTDEEIDETIVQRTSKTTRDRTTLEETTDRPRGTSPTQKPSPRGTSPSEKPRGPTPTEETVVQRTTKVTTDRTTVDDRSPKDRPRGTSPTEKPRRRPSTDEEIDETIVQRTSKTTRDRTTLEETTDRPRGTSPSQKPSPRGTSPSEKPRGPRPTEETLVQRTTKATTDRTTVDDRSPKDRPRGTSPTEKPRRRPSTDEEIDETIVQRTSKTTRDRTTLEETTDRPRGTSPSQKPSPRGTSPSEKPRGPRPTEETLVQRTTKVTTDRTTVDDRSPKDRPRGTSPMEKPRRRPSTDEEIDETIVQRTSKTTRDRTTLEEITDRPRGTSPTQKPSPRGTSPSEKPRGPRPTEEKVVQRTTKVTTDRTTVDDRSLKDRPRGTSPTEKPRRRPSTDEEIDETIVQRTSKTTRDRTTLEEITDRPRGTSPTQKPSLRGTSPSEKPRGPRPTEETIVQRTTKVTTDRTTVDDRSPKDRPRDRSPTEKPRGPRPGSDTLVQKTVKTTTIEDRSPKGPRGTPREIATIERLPKGPRGTSPSEKPSPRGSPRDRSPTEKPRGPRVTSETITQRTVNTATTDRTSVNDRSLKDRPRGSSPSEKPTRRRPTDLEQTVVKRTSKIIKDRTTLDETDVEDRSPKDRPSDEETDEETVETIIEFTTTGEDRPRDTSPLDKPRRRQPTDEEIEQTIVQRSTKTTKNRTVEELEVRDHPRGKTPKEKPTPRDRSPTEKPKGLRPTGETTRQTTVKTTTTDRTRGISPSEKPRRREPSDEEIVVEKIFTITNDGTCVEEINVTDRYPDGRPRNRSPTGKPRGPSPTEKPRRRQPTDEDIKVNVVQKTSKTIRDRTTLEQTKDRPREHSPSEKPYSRPQKPSNGEIDRYPVDRPRDRSPSEKPKGTEETILHRTVKTTTVRGTSPSEKPRRYQPDDEESDETLKNVEDRPRDGSPRRLQPSEVDETTLRSTTSRTTLQQTDFEKRYPKGRPTDQSPVEKPTTRRPSKPATITSTTTRNRSTLEEQDLTKSTRPRTQPSTRDKVPTKTTTSYPRSQPTTERRIPAELPSPGRKPKSTFGATTTTTTQTIVTKVPATYPKGTKEVPKKPTRPGARQPERKHSPSISPDSSPSRPTSEIDGESPNRSPNTSPSRKSPSPTRSVKLEDITSSVVTTKKTTVSIDKSKPKVTHITTAKFQVSPPTSPTKVTNAPDLKPSRKPVTKAPIPKFTGSRSTTDKTTTKKVTTTRKDTVIPTDSERDSEVPTDLEDIDSPLTQRTPTRKLPVTERKESAPVHRVTQLDRDIQKMSRSTSENIIKTPISKRPLRHEPLEPITQREPTKPTAGKTSPKTERRPSKHLTTKTINLTTFDKVINSQDMENVVIDIQQAKSSREPSPNKIVPTPVSLDLYTGKPRYPDVVQEPEDEPRRKPNVKNIPIFEEETNDFVGCQITEVNEESFEGTTKIRTRKFIDEESRPQRPTPTIVTGDNVDNECLLSVHDKVSKFISTAEEVSKPKTSAPFRRDVPEEEDVPEDDECLLTVDEKVNKFLKTAESVTREVITSTPKPIERPRIDDLDEDLRTDECVLSVSEKVNKFTTKAEKLAPSAPQRSPELVARIERQISRQSDAEPESPRYPESPEDDDSPTTIRKVKQTSSRYERDEKRQIDILSRPSVWDKKPKVSDIKLDDILGPEDEPEPVDGAPRRSSPVKDQPDVAFSKPVKPITDSVSKKKQIFESKVSTQKVTKPSSKSPERVPKSPSRKQPSDESDARYPDEIKPRYPQEPDDVHEDVYGSLKTRRAQETTRLQSTTVRQSSERSPTRKSSHPEIRPTIQTPTRTSKQPEQHSPSPRRYSDDHSPRRHPTTTRDHPQTDLYMETQETSEYTTRRRSSTQKYPEDHSPDRRTPQNKSPSPSRKQPQQPVDEPEDYTFSSRREETNKHHHTTRTSYRSPKDSPLNQTSIPDDEDHDHSPARSTSTISSQKRTTSTHRTTSNRLTEDTTSRRPRRPSGNEPSTPTSAGRTPRSKGVPETVAARRNIFEKSPGDVSPRTGQRRPSYMDHTKSSLEHTRKDSLEITKTNYSRKSSMEDEPYEASPRSAVKFGVGLKHKEEPKPRRKLSTSDLPNIEDVFELDLLEEMLNIVTLYEQRRRIRAQIRVVKKLLETKTKEEVSRMTKITTFRRTSLSSVRDSPIPRRDTPIKHERYQPSDDIDSESIIESRHVEEREEIIRERSISPQTKTSKTVTKVTEVRKIGGEPLTPKRTVLKKDEPKDSKPIWATKNILKKPSENEKVARALSAKKTTSTSSTSTSRTQQTHRQRVPADEDCITSSYGIGPTDEDGRPLFGIRALKKKTTSSSKPSETTKVTGTVITEKYYSENGAEPVGERKVTVYSTNPEDLVDLETQYDRRDSETVKRERLSKDGLTTVTKVQKIGKYKPGEVPAITDDPEFIQTTPKTVRRGSVKEMSEKFIRKESSSSVTEKSSGYPKAGLILRTRTNSGATADAADQYEVRAKSAEYDDESENECDVQIRTSRKHSKVVTESEDETEIRRKVNTRSFLNSAGSKVTGVDDVLDRMRNADNVDGDTLEDREARALLNKFLGASVLMTGMESIIPQKELKKAKAGADKLKQQEVKTTRVTKTIKTAAAGGSSSSPVARETCDFEEIWDEETLKELLEKSTSYEERRSIRARLRQLMAEREACAELVASVKAELDNDKKVTSTSGDDKKVVDEEQQQNDDESSCSEYEEIIEEYTASEDEEDKTTVSAVTVTVADQKKKEVVKDEQITKEIEKTTITKKEEPKQVETKKTVVIEKTTVIEKDATPSSVDEKKQQNDTTNKLDDDETSAVSGDNSKGESLLIPLLQGLLHKNMPQARSSNIATTTTTTTNKSIQNSNNLKSSLKSNNTHFSSTSSNNNNSLGDSGLSSEVNKSSSIGQPQGGSSSLRVTAQQIEDSGTESGEDLRLIAAGIRDSMQIEGIEDQSDMSLIKEVTNALNRLESSLKEGKDLALDNSKKNTLLALVERLQTGLTAPDKLGTVGGEQDFPDETSSPEADNHRSNRQRFAKRRNRNNRHTVGVSKEELEDARRYMEEKVMIENLSSCTTPESNAATTPPQFFAIQKQYSTGAILSNHDNQQASSGLFRPNQFVPNNLKHSTEAGTPHVEVQLRPKKGNLANGQRQSTGDMDYMTVSNPDASAGKRPLSDSYDTYSAQSSRVTFSDTKEQNEVTVKERNQYNRSHNTYNQPDVINRTSPDSSRFNRFNNKKQLMKRANTIDIPKTHRYNPEFDTDSDFEEKSTFSVKGLRGTVQVSVKRKPRQVVPNFEPKTENDHKFLAFIQKQNATPGLGWNSSKSVSNWTNKFGNIKNVFESGAATSNPGNPKVSAPPASSAKNFWKKADEQAPPPKVSTSVLTSALKAKERNEQKISAAEVVVPKPIHVNKFSHNPQSAFRPIDTSPETPPMQFKPIPMERPVNVVNNVSPTKAYNPGPSRKQHVESPHYLQPSPTKSWVKKNTATNSPVTLPWTVKPPENSALKMAATKFESKSPLNAVQRHQSFKQQEKRPSLPNAAYPYQYQYDGYSQPCYMSNSQPASYAEYPPPRITRESSLTNPQAEPLVLTPDKPAYSPHSLQPFDYYTGGISPSFPQTDMTDDDIDDMESMTEYRVEAKVMGKPVSQQAVTVGKRTAHVSDDEVFGKNSRAAKSLLSVMKNIGNGNGGKEKASKKVERKIAPSTCMSPDGRAYQAPVVEPLFPEVTKFESNRMPEYIGPQSYKQQQKPQGDYQKNPVYVPLVDYEHQQPPVAPPRGRKVAQEKKGASPYIPQERPNAYPEPRREAPSSLPLQTGPLSPPNYSYNSPSKTPEITPYVTQIVTDGMHMQNVPTFRQPYSGPNTPDDYRPVVNLPQIPLETSFTKVYDKPRDIAPYYQPPVTYQTSPNYDSAPSQPLYAPQPQEHKSPNVQQFEIPPQYYQPPIAQPPRSEALPQYNQSSMVHQSQQPPAFAPQQPYQPKTEAPAPHYQPPKMQQSPQQSPQYYQSPKIQQSPQQPAFVAQQSEVPPQYYQSPKIQQSPQPFIPPQAEVPPQYYQSPKIQQSPQQPAFVPQQPEVSPQYYQSPKVQQSPQQPVFVPQQPEVSPQYYQSPKVQQSPQQPAFIPQQIEVPPQYYQSPKIQQSPQPPTFAPQQADVPPQFYQSPKVQQSPQPPAFAPQQTDVPPQFYQSPKVQQNPQPPTFSPQQSYQSPKVQQTSKPPSFVPKTEAPAQTYQSPKTQQSQQPLPTKAPVAKQQTQKQALQPKPHVPPKSETVTHSSKSQTTSSTHRQQQSQKTVAPASPVTQPIPNNSAILCKQASLDGRKRVQSQSQLYERVEEVRRKSLGNVLEITRLEREAREQKAAAIKQDMYSVQQDVYSQQVKTAQKTELRQQTTVYKSSAPDDTPDIVKSSLAKEDIPILKKFGPPQRHCYIPNAYQNPLTKSETVVAPPNAGKLAPRKFSEPSVKGPVIVETPSTPQPDGQDEIPRNIVFNNVSAFTSMSRNYGESSTETYTSQQNRPNKLSKCDSWHQICQLQNATKPPSPKFNTSGGSGSALRRSKSGHTLALPKLYEAGYDRTQITEKQKTVAAYFSGQKSPNSLSRNSSQTNLADEHTSVSVKKSSINRIKTSQKASISRQNPSSGLSRSHTMPQIANVNLLDESNVEDAFEQLMNELSTTTTEKTETKEEDGGVVTTTTKVTTRTVTGAPKPVSPFAKFQQLDKQSSLQSPKSPLTPTTPGGSSSTPIFRFTDPALNARAATVKEQLLQWCQSKTQEYENVQITNFSASWTDGLAFCALIHHFLPDAFDYSKLSPKQRRYNFELAFRVADEKAGIAPLLDVEDMVVMRRPDWKCVFTYVQSIYRRFRNCQ